ncbi:glutathione S-transferase [Aspergillus floccosus]
MQPILLYSHRAGPNPKKVRMIIEELCIPHGVKDLEFPEMKNHSFLSINPNGRVSAIVDPNTSTVLWKSGAIIEYLVETYDEDRNISFTPYSPEYYQANQWRHFPMSGQGPYFGQAVWFKVHHPEFLQTCYDRYVSEIRRVAGFMDCVLENQAYLVRGRCSYADISFVIWFQFVPWITENKIDLRREYPHLNTWLNSMEARPAIRNVLGDVRKLPQPARKA